MSTRNEHDPGCTGVPADVGMWCCERYAIDHDAQQPSTTGGAMTDDGTRLAALLQAMDNEPAKIAGGRPPEPFPSWFHWEAAWLLAHGVTLAGRVAGAEPPERDPEPDRPDDAQGIGSIDP